MFFYRTSIRGTENIPKKGAIIAPNHESFLDPPLISQSYRRSMHFFAKKKLYSKKILGFLLWNLHTYPIEKGEKSSEAMGIATKLLDEDKLVVLFPEGTRTRDGKLGQLKRGVAKLALKTGAPIIPTWIEGAYDAWPRKQSLPKLFKPLRCVYGEPIDATLYSHLPEETAVDEILNELRVRYQQLMCSSSTP